MLLLLLVSIQVTILIMDLFDTKHNLTTLKVQKNSKFNPSLKEEPLLCNHCKRTASNGVRCLGMCVADNDY